MSESTELTVAEAKDIVTQIAQRKGWIPPDLRESRDPDVLRLIEIIENVRDELGGAVTTLARDIYSRKARFILELIQNAEDNSFTKTREVPSITFELRPGKIIVECNEDGFTKIHVESICHIGMSSKKSNRGYIGEKGIGFKSVFQVASKIQIQSNPFSFYFQYNGGTSTVERLGIITPIPEDQPIPSSERPLTRMTLTTLQTIPYNEFLAQFQSIPDTLLLFLSTLKKIKIKIHDVSQKGFLTTFHKTEDLAAGTISLVKTVEDLDDLEEIIATEMRYRIVKKAIKHLAVDQARPNIDECEVVLAFPVDEDSSPLISAQDIFAFLPVRTIGLSFLIQADFILQANRQDIVDSARNRDILRGTARTFRDAVLQFCTSNSPLQHRWMRFLPPSQAPDEFWATFFSHIINLLKKEPILFAHGSLELFRPEILVTLPDSHLDRHKMPLFADCTRSRVRYLSRLYVWEDVRILSNAFGIHDITDDTMYDRIKQDLESPTSVMKAFDTREDWHTRAANLISSILMRNPHVGNNIRHLRLIPLADGNWVDAIGDDSYFPSENGPEIPLDLVMTVSPRATRNASRKELFRKLGVKRCSPREVIIQLWARYLRGDGASDISSSTAHIRYLYWNYENIDDDRLLRIWLYDKSERKVTSRQKILYFESDDEYGPQQLLKTVQHPRDYRTWVPECQVPFLNPAYMDVFPTSSRRHDLSWHEWLERALGVRRIPRLKVPGGALSPEFRHIIRYRPEKIIGTLKRHWAVYGPEMSPVIVDTLSQAEVACRDRAQVVLKKTYLPLPDLIEKVQRLGINRSFPFLKVPGTSDEENLLREWRFIADFGVDFTADLKFYVEILRLQEALNSSSWSVEVRDKVLKTYELIADLCSNRDKDWICEVINFESLILDPCVFQASVSIPCWIDVESCVWNGPENLLDKKPLASVPQYRDNQNLAHFFREILGIGDADWEDYLDMLIKLKENSDTSDTVADKVLRLYHLFSETTLNTQQWAEIRNSFEQEKLIYMPSTSEWFAPSACLWTSPVLIDGKAVISECYSEELKTFFLRRLKISPASLSTLVDELGSMAQRNPTAASVKRMIWAINAMNPKQGELDTLLTSNVLPIRTPEQSPNGSISFQSSQAEFVIIDRNKLAEIFEGVAAFLDFTLEEVQQLYPFLQAMGLSEKYISTICEEDTACIDDGLIDSALTESFKQRAYDLLRCAVSQRSPRSMKNPTSLYDLLLSTSIYKTDGITTQYTLRQVSGNKIVHRPIGYVHIREQESRWEILVPRNRRDRELCYLRYLPEALRKVFQIAPSAREIIGNVLNSSHFVIDDLLEAAGIGTLSAIPPPQRPSSEESSEQETIVTEDVVSSRYERAQSVISQTSRPRLSQLNSPSTSSLRNLELPTGLSGVDVVTTSSTATSPHRFQFGTATPPRHFRFGTPSTATSDVHDRPISRGSEAANPNLSQDPAEVFRRSLGPELFDRANSDRNDAYRELLDNVIRIASRTDLPQRDHMAIPDNTQLHHGFDHASAFGIRSQGQMTHDIKIGAAGELFVFEILSNLLPASFGRHNWKSTIRREVAIHPNYHDIGSWSGAETADIVYGDTVSNLTALLIQKGYLDDSVWRGANPTYYIEVKTTTGEWNDRFFMSNSQYLRMQRMTLTPGQAAAEVYMFFRVFNLSRNSLGVKIYVDPEAYRRRNELLYEAQSWTVTPRV